MPGEPERRQRAERLAAGVDVDERTWAEILAAARDVGVSDGEIDALTLSDEGRRAWSGSTAW